MKEYLINHSYRGRFFDIRLCAKSFKEAAERIDTTTCYLRTYGVMRKISDPYNNIKATPYCHKAKSLFAPFVEIDFDEAKKVIDEAASETSKQWRT